MPRKGLLIAFEGLDRAGKTTCISALVDSLKNRKIQTELIRFPLYETKIGQIIRSHVIDNVPIEPHAIHLLFSANRWEMKDKIETLLSQGVCLVLDRYFYSGITYTAAKGIPYDWCLSPDSGLPIPDITFFLSLTPEEAAARMGYGEDIYEEKAFQDKIRTLYSRFEKNKEWMKIDAARTKEEVLADITHALDPLLAGKKLQSTPK
ncbi:MAG: thymidylate kinase [Amphiamblys sp. WSBS2006]|nr:MAG: thymidylate kinase [Amphiamblys sp. WSBS2006]